MIDRYTWNVQWRLQKVTMDPKSTSRLVCSQRSLPSRKHEEPGLTPGIGLFPIGSTPRPSVDLFVKDLEDWEKPVEGAKVYQTQ